MTEREWRELPHLQREVKLLQGQLERLRRAQEGGAAAVRGGDGTGGDRR